jgi:RNA polymerase subunit RPABC4/transcription elongation factor Spt4
MTDEVVARLHQCLLDELRSREHPLGRPLTVAQICEEVIPYGAVRSKIRVELNADYEHALLRLLAGERGLLRIEPEEVRKELEREAAEPFPDVGVFRRYSGFEVWVDTGAPDVTRPASPDRAAAPAAPAAVPARRAGPAAVDPQPARPVAAEARPATAPRKAAPGHDGPHGSVTQCVACERRLPPGREARFCPFCGADQTIRKCSRCEAVLESGWRYCIACGQDQGAG